MLFCLVIFLTFFFDSFFKKPIETLKSYLKTMEIPWIVPSFLAMKLQRAAAAALFSSHTQSREELYVLFLVAEVLRSSHNGLKWFLIYHSLWNRKLCFLQNILLIHTKAKFLQVSTFFHKLVPSLSNFVNEKVGKKLNMDKIKPTFVLKVYMYNNNNTRFFSIFLLFYSKIAQWRNRFKV